MVEWGDFWLFIYGSWEGDGNRGDGFVILIARKQRDGDCEGGRSYGTPCLPQVDIDIADTLGATEV
ncbi:MAG: hypothetical protein EBS59_09575 [Verrucomicrobia bacterium]|nr:hypothetical protein [Verrucomicrobiota bacterium]